MAKTQKKPAYPSKTCPKCGELIHARSQKHEACGWVMPTTGGAKKVGRAMRKSTNGRRADGLGGISMEDIAAVKKLVDRMGAEKVQQLAHVLAK